jgi:hypothetical protein
METGMDKTIPAVDVLQEQRPPRVRGRPFVKGRSGNPLGRRLGSRNKATLAAQTLLDGEAERLTSKAIELALEGDLVALKICLDRISPPRRDRIVTAANMPPLRTAADGPAAIAAIVAAVAAGEIAPAEGMDLTHMVETFLAVCKKMPLNVMIAGRVRDL